MWLLKYHWFKLNLQIKPNIRTKLQCKKARVKMYFSTTNKKLRVFFMTNSDRLIHRYYTVFIMVTSLQFLWHRLPFFLSLWFSLLSEKLCCNDHTNTCLWKRVSKYNFYCLYNSWILFLYFFRISLIYGKTCCYFVDAFDMHLYRSQNSTHTKYKITSFLSK